MIFTYLLIDMCAFHRNKKSPFLHHYNIITTTGSLWHVHSMYIDVPGATVATKPLWSCHD